MRLPAQSISMSMNRASAAPRGVKVSGLYSGGGPISKCEQDCMNTETLCLAACIGGSGFCQNACHVEYNNCVKRC